MAALRSSFPKKDGSNLQELPSHRNLIPWPRIAQYTFVAALSTLTAIILLPGFNRAVVLSLIRQTAVEHGLSPDDFLRMAEIESALDPFAYHPASEASGLFQFLPSTAQQYGLHDVFDARANAAAAAALWRDNARLLQKRLGREPSPGEVYLAHQQGATGAIKLLTNPNRPAKEVVGYDAVTMNGGTEDMTAKAFAAMWMERFQQN